MEATTLERELSERERAHITHPAYRLEYEHHANLRVRLWSVSRVGKGDAREGRAYQRKTPPISARTQRGSSTGVATQKAPRDELCRGSREWLLDLAGALEHFGLWPSEHRRRRAPRAQSSRRCLSRLLLRRPALCPTQVRQPTMHQPWPPLLWVEHRQRPRSSREKALRRRTPPREPQRSSQANRAAGHRNPAVALRGSNPARPRVQLWRLDLSHQSHRATASLATRTAGEW